MYNMFIFNNQDNGHLHGHVPNCFAGVASRMIVLVKRGRAYRCVPCGYIESKHRAEAHFYKLEDLKVLRRSPDLLNNVKIGQGQLQLIMEQILFYHIWGLQTFWSSDLNNLMNNPSNSPVISEKQMFR